ncbi:MAG TPA: sialidase family protein [Clostridia bacterium]|nr:sialidase family protein [Clostridia bacterium]
MQDFIKQTKVVLNIPPTREQPRNSEGDFIRLNDGRIMFAYSQYSGGVDDHAPCNIAAVFLSYNGDEVVGGPKILVKASEHFVKNIMSVTLLRMKNGDLGLFYLVKNNDATSSYVLRRSADEGQTFGEPVFCLPDKFAGYYVVNNCRVLRTRDGRLYVPAALHRSAVNDEKVTINEGYGVCHLFYSDDDGISWQEHDTHFVIDTTDTKTGLQEPDIIELSSGVLKMYFRTDRMYQYECYSHDNGRHWTKPEASCFTSPNSPMKISQNPYDGSYFAVWNPIPQYIGREADDEGFFNGGRTPLVIAKSNDGINFDKPIELENDPNRGYCYPAVFFVDKNTILLSYCSGGFEDLKSCLTKTTIRKIVI